MHQFRSNLASRERCLKLFDPNIDKVDIIDERTKSDCILMRGKFRSPLARHIPEWMPPPNDTALFVTLLHIAANNQCQ